MREVVVTAGGLSEPIDSVRSITNTSTGALGALIADEFARNGDRVTYVCPKNAVLPTDLSSTQIHYVTTARDTLECVKYLLESNTYQIFVHAMAVSDFEVANTTPALAPGEKLPSNAQTPVIYLKPTPKIIAQIKALQPSIYLVGFKLLSQVDLEELFEVAERLRAENQCDVVVANRLEDVQNSSHTAYFCDANGATLGGKTKQEIALNLVKRCTERSTKWI